MNTRRSFIRNLALAIVAGPAVVKAALAKREPRNYRTVFNPNWKEVDLRNVEVTDYRGIETMRSYYAADGSVCFESDEQYRKRIGSPKQLPVATGRSFLPSDYVKGFERAWSEMNDRAVREAILRQP